MSEHAAPPPAPTFADKTALYEWLTKQVEYLIDGMSSKLTPQANLVIGLGNVSALCFYELNRFADPAASLQSVPVNWFGFYLLQAPGLLALGPFQGRPACTEIRVGKGVCGAAAMRGETLVIPDVHEFPGHIACDSASNAEVVAPILSENGTVLGVIDVDSVVAGHFDAADGKGLEAIAAVLAKHLEFPMARALACNPFLAMPASSPFVGDAEPKDPSQPSLPAPPPTRVTTTGIPFFTIEAVRPDSTQKEVRDWTFTTTRLDRIMNQSELEELEKRLGIAAFPEIQFPFNTLTVAHKPTEAAKKRPVLTFDVASILADAAAYYQSDHFSAIAAPQLTIPVSQAWVRNRFEKHDPHVDWAWRHRYFGVSPAEAATRLTPLLPGMHEINWDLLKDRTLPIIFFDAFDFFEDDLHDHGDSCCSVKFRVMEEAFFILFRLSVRVNGHALWLREVRFYHEFAWAEEQTAPYVVVEEQTKLLSLAAPQDGSMPLEWRGVSVDELSAKAPVIDTNRFALTI